METSTTSSSATLCKGTSAYCARFALCDANELANDDVKAIVMTYQRNTPTLSTCEVAKKSFVGENEMLVATLEVRKRSMSRPVGTSNVRIIESSDVVTSHLESGEKV